MLLKYIQTLILIFCFVLQGESNVQEIKEQLEALTAHVDYVQENITDCQTSIMEMEVWNLLDRLKNKIGMDREGVRYDAWKACVTCAKRDRHAW